MTRQIVRWEELSSPEVVHRRAAERILDAAANCIAAKGCFSIVLTGGSAARGIYPLLRQAAGPWVAWQIYWGDERCLAVDDPERNSHLAASLWLDHVALSPNRVFPIPAELGAVEAARRYDALVRDLPTFDLVLLGLGEDGHVASLFPDGDWRLAADGPAALAVLDAPKPPSERVSLSAWRLSRATQVLVVATGSGKRPAIAGWRRGLPLPAAALAPVGGVDVLADRAAFTDNP